MCTTTYAREMRVLCKRCGLNLSRETLYNNAAYPKPDCILSCFAYCDELYKAGEMLSLQHGVRHIHLSDIKGISYAAQEDYLCERTDAAAA